MATAKPKKIWDNFVEVGEVRKSDGIKFVIAAATREGFRYINIREFYFRKRDGVWTPGKDGLTLPIVMPINKGNSILKPASQMIEQIKQAIPVAAGMDLADEKNAVWYTPKEK